MKLNSFFEKYRRNIIGEDICINNKKIIYADWAGSGRFYSDIENEIIEKYAPLYGNIHSENTYIGKFIEESYKTSKDIIRKYFNANNDYSVISTGFGMTAAIFKLQDILLSRNENANNSLSPVVFLTEYEHNSNYLSWMNRNCECVIIKNNELGQPDIKYLKEKLEKYKERKIKIASLSACSNITGIIIELKPIINLVKKYNVITCVDYTTLAPYKNINLLEFDNKIDALFFSGHKFLGGVGSSGILLINKSIYNCDIPTRVGGGVIEYVKPNKQIVYKNSIDEREEAGTPGIIQTIKASLALKLKEQMDS